MLIITAYYYWFYTIYNLFHKAYNPERSRYNAVSVMIVLEISIMLSCINYIEVVVGYKVRESFSSLNILIPFVAIILSKIILFSINTNWKRYISKFNSWPQKKNFSGKVIILMITLALIANFFISCYLTTFLHFQQYMKERIKTT